MGFLGQVRKMCESFSVALDFEKDDCQDDIHSIRDVWLAQKFAFLRGMTRMGKPLSFLYLALLNRDTQCKDDRDKNLWALR
jgi:hypothetical protein